MTEQASRVTSAPPFMSVAEFRARGYLAEVNRRFFHPLGMALVVAIYADGDEKLAGIKDRRDDEEGLAFTVEEMDVASRERSDAIDAEIAAKANVRIARLGGVVQPYPEIGS